jgi:predicted Holliday junction resolvase-like endonuclease
MLEILPQQKLLIILFLVITFLFIDLYTKVKLISELTTKIECLESSNEEQLKLIKENTFEINNLKKNDGTTKLWIVWFIQSSNSQP